MADFLLELLSEEIPARMQAKARNDLARMFAEVMAGVGLSTGAVDVHSTPRRLVLVAREVATQTEASREELKGPRTSAPDQALEGFLRKTGLTRDQLEERDGVYFAVIERTGQACRSPRTRRHRGPAVGPVSVRSCGGSPRALGAARWCAVP